MTSHGVCNECLHDCSKATGERLFERLVEVNSKLQQVLLSQYDDVATEEWCADHHYI